MDIRELGWAVFLAGLPFAHLLFRPLDPWHGQAAWAQGWAVILYAMTLGTDGRPSSPNRGLALFVVWSGLWTWWRWIDTMKSANQYSIQLLPAVLHLIILLLLYQSAMATWTAAMLQRLLRVMAWAGVVVMGYCLLQLCQLDQFFVNLDPSHLNVDQLVGTVGNPDHLAVQLAMVLPLFWLQSGWFWIGMIACAGGLLLCTGSLTGQVAAIIALIVLCYRWKPWTAWVSLLSVLGVGGYLIRHPALINDHGRFHVWALFSQLFVKQPITGFGPGFIMDLSRTITDVKHPLFGWRHVHNEYFQAMMEYGVLGCVGLAGMTKEVIQIICHVKPSPILTALIGVLVAFAVTSLTLYPAHLWVTGSYALVAYCGVRVLAQEA